MMSTLPSGTKNKPQWYNYAAVGLRGCVTRTSEPFTDDFGNLIEFWMPNQNRFGAVWYMYHTSYHTGHGKDTLYIV